MNVFNFFFEFGKILVITLRLVYGQPPFLVVVVALGSALLCCINVSSCVLRGKFLKIFPLGSVPSAAHIKSFPP